MGGEQRGENEQSQPTLNRPPRRRLARERVVFRS